MKLRTLSILTIGALLLCAPLAMAQTEEQEPSDQPVMQEPAPDTQESLEPEVSAEADVSAEAEVSATYENEEGISDSGEAEVTTDEELPQTASPLPLLALLGLGAASAALGVRRFRRSEG